MANTVSSCCGYNYSEETLYCGCEVYKCESPHCKTKYFDEPVDEYEYEQEQLDAKKEMEADEARDMG